MRSQRHLRAIRGVDSAGTTAYQRGERSNLTVAQQNAEASRRGYKIPTAAIPTGSAPFVINVARNHAYNLNGRVTKAWGTLALAGTNQGTRGAITTQTGNLSRTPTANGVYTFRLYDALTGGNLLAESPTFTVTAS